MSSCASGQCVVDQRQVLPQHVAEGDLWDVSLQQFDLGANEHPPVHLPKAVPDVLQNQSLKAPGRHTNIAFIYGMWVDFKRVSR